MVKNLKNYNTIFFVGIGGVSMSALALLLKDSGKVVLGSDINRSKATTDLEEKGIKIFYKHQKENIKNCDLVVYTGAINGDNEELKEAKLKKINIIERSELLGIISKEYKNVIAISGTHGKTTTTAMIGYIFCLYGLDPTVHIGGNFDYFKGNLRIGSKMFFITEACEFRDSFLRLKPNVSVVTNIESEHLDYFKTFNKELKSFKKFVKDTKQTCFINEKSYLNFKKNANAKSFGLSNSCDIFATNIVIDENKKVFFDCFRADNIIIGRFELNVYGDYNIENAICAISVCLYFGIDYKTIYLGLKNFKNVRRRFEEIGKVQNSPVIIDYAHHPTEIKSVINTTKKIFNKKIICIFQPHTFSRTKSLINEFKKCFLEVDKLFLLKTYSARENYDYYGSSEYLVKEIEKEKINVSKNTYNKNSLIKAFKKEDVLESVILFLGAGDINLIAEDFVKN